MDIKRSLIFGLCTLLSIITYQAQATCCCRRPICYFPSTSNMQGYVDVGVGQTLSSHLEASDNVLMPDTSTRFLISSLATQKMAVENNLLIESGVLWSQPFTKAGSYFPYANLGLRYQYSNLNNDQTLLRFTSAGYGGNNNLDFQSFSDGYFDFSQHSLLATLKLDLYRWRRIMPYISAGLGTTWNRGKQKTPLYFDADRRFNTIELKTDVEKNTTFSYSLGAGFDFPINEHFWLSLGYQYNHLGDISLNPKLVGLNGAAQDLIKERNLNAFFKPFNLKNLHTQTIQLTGRYLFG